MKAFVFFIIVLGVWLAYKKSNGYASRQRSRRPNPHPALGATSTLSRGYGATGNYPTSGNSSPGSGVRSVQPELVSSYALGMNGGNYGSTGVSYR